MDCFHAISPMVAANHAAFFRLAKGKVKNPTLDFVDELQPGQRRRCWSAVPFTSAESRFRI
jgi:hypothetical protein